MSGENLLQDGRWFSQEDEDMLVAEMMKAGVPEEVAKVFICLRFHPTHPWGLTSVKVNGVGTSAIIVPGDMPGTGKVVYLLLTQDMMDTVKVTSYNGVPMANNGDITMEYDGNQKLH